MFLSLDRPDRIRLLHDAKGWANVGAKPDLDRARDGLVRMREAAEAACVLVRTATLPEPADLVASRAEDAAAAGAVRSARSEAEAATAACRVHAGRAPVGWRRVVGWASGANARHQATGVRLAAAEVRRVRAVEEAREKAQRAAAALHRAIERHEAAIRACREGYRAQANAAPARIPAVEAALGLLYQRPELARMGPSGLLRAGYAINEARERATLDPEVDVPMAGPGGP